MGEVGIAVAAPATNKIPIEKRRQIYQQLRPG